MSIKAAGLVLAAVLVTAGLALVRRGTPAVADVTRSALVDAGATVCRG